MPKKLDIEVETRILTLSDEKWPVTRIREHLLKVGHNVSTSTIRRVILCIGFERNAKRSGQKYIKKQPRTKVTSAIIRKIDNWTSGSNPKYQTYISKKVNISRRHVARVIKNDLEKNLTIKPRGQRLTEKDMKNRKMNSRKFLELIRGSKIEYVVTLDESWMVLDEYEHETKHVYLKKDEEFKEHVRAVNERFKPKQMVAVGMCGRGTLPVIKVPSNATVDARTYVKVILRPYFEKYLPKLYPGEMHKIIFHQDKSRSHTASFTVAELDRLRSKYGITFQNPRDIPVKGADISPMDFFGFGYLKQKSASSKAKSLEGLCKVWQRLWSKVTPKKCLDVFRNWKKRLPLVIENDGAHIEYVKKLHKRKTPL